LDFLRLLADFSFLCFLFFLSKSEVEPLVVHEDASEEEVEVDENVRSRMIHHDVSSSKYWWYHQRSLFVGLAIFGHPHLHLICLFEQSRITTSCGIDGIDTEIMGLLE
jgi:hypothetical protein